jgi:hypothetical protein
MVHLLICLVSTMWEEEEEEKEMDWINLRFRIISIIIRLV